MTAAGIETIQIALASGCYRSESSTLANLVERLNKYLF